ncbi:MAG: hypothetical protein QOD34_173 [Mycobacterium sp.]|jgi:hypothetical protein|nr:hypothetical protein [Mycobacterium sp.]
MLRITLALTGPLLADFFRAVGRSGAVLMKVLRRPSAGVDALAHAVHCDTRHMTLGHTERERRPHEH